MAVQADGTIGACRCYRVEQFREAIMFKQILKALFVGWITKKFLGRDQSRDRRHRA